MTHFLYECKLDLLDLLSYFLATGVLLPVDLLFLSNIMYLDINLCVYHANYICYMYTFSRFVRSPSSDRPALERCTDKKKKKFNNS